MIVNVRLDGFYVRSFEDDGRSLAVIRDRLVLDCTESARARGVHEGMTLREAKSILHDGRFEDWNEDDYRDEQRKWLDLCCEFSDVVEPVDQHRAYVDLSLHPHPLEILTLMRERLHEQTRCLIAVGYARSKWMATVALNSGDEGRAYADPDGFLYDLPTRQLLPVPAEHLERLVLLGYHTVGQVATLTMKVLQAQFGDDAVTIYRAIRGGCVEPVQAMYPLSCAAARFRFDDPTDSLEAIDNALIRIASSLGKRLMDADLQGCDLRLVLATEEGDLSVEHRYAKPMQSKASVLFCLRRLVEGQIDRPDQTIESDRPSELTNRWLSIRVQMPNLTRAKRKQANLYTWKATDQKQAADFAMSQLHKTFGLDSVVLANQIVDSRHKRVLKVWKDAIGWV